MEKDKSKNKMELWNDKKDDPYYTYKYKHVCVFVSVAPLLTSGGMRAVSPTTFAHHTIRYEKAAIHSMEPMNVTG